MRDGPTQDDNSLVVVLPPRLASHQVSRLLETVAPRRLGPGFRWLMAGFWSSSLGDGIALAAGPLLVASQTDDPLLVAMAVLLQQLPWLLFGLHAGALADRLDRRTIVVTVDVLRVAVLAVLVLAIGTGRVSISVVLLALFLLGTAEVMADSAASTLLPMLVGRADLALGNARLMTGHLTLNQMAGPPVGAALFAAGAVWPFLVEAVLVGLAGVLVSRLVLPPHGRQLVPVETHLRADIAEGWHWVRRHAAVRTLILTILIFNLTYGAAWSVLVLYAREQLGMGAIGFGLITTALAVGGAVGTAAYGWITRRVSLGNVMRVGLVIETLTHLGLALATTPVVAMPIFVVFGAHAFVWGTTSITVRQRAVPTQLQGRVNGLNTLGVSGGMVVGAALGGLIAQRWGVTATFWFAFLGSAVFLLVLWPQMRHIAHADEELGEPARRS